ncbi:MAG: aldehyde ferredoxin oxidoreductase family protein [Acetobacteraceae bacterium]|nr:aldehyde ferredoxin oxidoreductase family protein [Acetobacteraceae bacterium]
MAGWWGSLLEVDLSTGAVDRKALDEATLKQYLGGTGLGVRLAWDRIPPGTDPLGPENLLMFLVGPLSGTGYPSSGRYELVFLSPLTGVLCDSSSGGSFGAELKRAGVDGLVVKGRAARPAYLWISDGRVEVRDASRLWGRDALETQEAVRAELGDSRVRVAAVGPAGERGVLFACVINDDGRAAGRGGGGAVMGAKNLKAVAVRGRRRVPLADPGAFDRERSKVKKERSDPGWEGLSRYGTATVLDNNWGTGDVPVKNFSVGLWEQGCLNLGGKRMSQTILVEGRGCHACRIRCGRWVRVPRHPYAFVGPGPEYESLAALGTLNLVDDLEAVAYAAHLCNLYGLDTISTGSVVAFATEAMERGLLSPADLGGLHLSWGDASALVAAVELIGEAKSPGGRLLGQGVRRLSARLGGGAADFACEVKGLEAPMHDPRCYFSLGLTYAVSNRGACHLHGYSNSFERRDPLPEWGLCGDHRRFKEGKAQVAAVAQDHAALVDSLVLCSFMPLFYRLQPSDLALALNAATGAEFCALGLRRAGERISNLHRCYNLRAGLGKADDRLPPRMVEPLAEGGHAGKALPLARLLREFYEVRGWDENGRPTRGKLEELGLGEVAEALAGA